MELHVSFLQLAHKKQARTARERDATLFVRAITGTATESKKGREATVHVLDCVSEGQLNERLMNGVPDSTILTNTIL